MTSAPEWPDEIWITEIDNEYSPAGYYYLSQPDGGEPYVHQQVLEDQRKYTDHMLEQVRAEARKAALREAAAINEEERDTRGATKACDGLWTARTRILALIQEIAE